MIETAVSTMDTLQFLPRDSHSWNFEYNKASK